MSSSPQIEPDQTVVHPPSVEAHENESHEAAPPPYAKKRLVLSFLLLTAALLTGGVIWARGSFLHTEKKAANDAQAQATPQASIPPDIVVIEEQELKQISIEPVVEKTVAVELETTGKVAFNEDRMTPVFTPYAGRVVEVLVNKGAVVRAGQPMLIVESPDYVTAQNELSAARSEVGKAKIAVEAAQKVADRLRLLHQREAIATKDVQQSETDLARVQEELRRNEAATAVARNKLGMFGKDAQEIEQLEQHPTEKLDRRITIRAPLGGTIVERKVGPGQYIKPDATDPLFMISDLSTLWVMADVYESFLGHLHVGTSVQISTAAFPDHYFPARISFINPTVDAATRTVHVRCAVSNAGGTLKPEMFAKIKIGGAGHQSVPAVPANAVISLNDAKYVLVEQAHARFQRREVKTGRDLDGYTTIVEGLKPADRIVTKGILLLNNGVGKAPEKDRE